MKGKISRLILRNFHNVLYICSQILAALSVSLCSLQIGYASSYTSPALVSMRDNATASFEVTSQMVSTCFEVQRARILNPCLSKFTWKKMIAREIVAFINRTSFVRVFKVSNRVCEDDCFLQTCSNNKILVSRFAILVSVRGILKQKSAKLFFQNWIIYRMLNIRLLEFPAIFSTFFKDIG